MARAVPAGFQVGIEPAAETQVRRHAWKDAASRLATIQCESVLRSFASAVPIDPSPEVVSTAAVASGPRPLRSLPAPVAEEEVQVSVAHAEAAKDPGAAAEALAVEAGDPADERQSIEFVTDKAVSSHSGPFQQGPFF